MGIKIADSEVSIEKLKLVKDSTINKPTISARSNLIDPTFYVCFLKLPHFLTTDNILNSLYLKYTFFHFCDRQTFLLILFLCVLFKSPSIIWVRTFIHLGLCCIFSWFHRWTWCTLPPPGPCWVKACSSVSKGVMRWKTWILLTWPKLTKPEIIWTYHY